MSYCLPFSIKIQYIHNRISLLTFYSFANHSLDVTTSHYPNYLHFVTGGKKKHQHIWLNKAESYFVSEMENRFFWASILHHLYPTTLTHVGDKFIRDINLYVYHKTVFMKCGEIGTVCKGKKELQILNWVCWTLVTPDLTSKGKWLLSANSRYTFKKRISTLLIIYRYLNTHLEWQITRFYWHVFYDK